MGGRGSSGGGSGGRGNYNLPTLKGSEKQVAWANDIMTNALSYADDMIYGIKQTASGSGIYKNNPVTWTESVKFRNGEKVAPAAGKKVKELLTIVFNTYTSADQVIKNRYKYDKDSIDTLAAKEMSSGAVTQTLKKYKASKKVGRD